MSKPRKYPMPDYKVPEGMVIVGYMNRRGRVYSRYAEAAEYNADSVIGSAAPAPLVHAVYTFVDGKDCLNT